NASWPGRTTGGSKEAVAAGADEISICGWEIISDMNGSRGDAEVGCARTGTVASSSNNMIRGKAESPKSEAQSPGRESARLWRAGLISPGAVGPIFGLGLGALAHWQAAFAVE